MPAVDITIALISGAFLLVVNVAMLYFTYTSLQSERDKPAVLRGRATEFESGPDTADLGIADDSRPTG